MSQTESIIQKLRTRGSYPRFQLHLNRFGLTEIDGEFIETILEHMPEINVLNLNNNGIKSIPKEITRLKGLKCLHLTGNELKTLPKEISYLKNLTHLYMKYNSFPTIPKVVTQLKRLEHLSLRGNQLKEITADIGKLSNLKYLILSRNLITSIPIEIGRLKNLEYLNIRYNNSLKAIPADLLRNNHISLLHSIDQIEEEYKETIKIQVPRQNQHIILNNFSVFENYIIEIRQKKAEFEVKSSKNQIQFEIIGEDSNEVANELEKYIDNEYQKKIFKSNDEVSVQDIKEDVRKYIQRGETYKALRVDSLIEYLKENRPQLYNEILANQGKLENISRSVRQGIISHKEKFTEEQNITVTLINILEEIE